jgi:hypothetical protein
MARNDAAHRAAISKALTGRPKSEAHRAAISAAMTEVSKSPDHRASLSRGQRRRWASTPRPALPAGGPTARADGQVIRRAPAAPGRLHRATAALLRFVLRLG